MKPNCSLSKCGCHQHTFFFEGTISSSNLSWGWYDNPKVCSSTIKKVLCLPSLSSVKPYTSKELFSFGFVRNPYSRMLSNYIMFTKDEYKKTRIAQCAEIFGVKVSDILKLSFDDFIQVIFDNFSTNLYQNHHWEKQSLFIPENLDYIGRFENFNEDFSRVLEKIKKNPSNIPIINKSTNVDKAFKISKISKSRIQQMYEEDFNRFSFNF